MHMQLRPVADNDERAGYPSASEYGRLLKCRASHLMAKKAKALGQVAHERSPASDLVGPPRGYQFHRSGAVSSEWTYWISFQFGPRARP